MFLKLRNTMRFPCLPYESLFAMHIIMQTYPTVTLSYQLPIKK